MISPVSGTTTNSIHTGIFRNAKMFHTNLDLCLPVQSINSVLETTKVIIIDVPNYVNPT